MAVRVAQYSLISFVLCFATWMPQGFCGNTGASTTTLSITPSASSLTTITAADENSRNSANSTWANAHVHSFPNTSSIGDGLAGNKNVCADAADTTDACIRWNDTVNLWTVDNPTVGTFNQIATMTGTVGLTVGGIVYGDGTGALQALAVMTNGQLLIGDGSGAPTIATLTAGSNITVTNGVGSITIAATGGTSVGGRVVRTAGDVTTTSTSLVDLTGASITVTTGANPVLIGFAGSCANSTLNARIFYNFDIDGSNELGTEGITIAADTANNAGNCSFSHRSAALTAASHTFKLRWAVSAGTGTTFCDTANTCSFWVQEQP